MAPDAFFVGEAKTGASPPDQIVFSPAVRPTGDIDVVILG